MARVTASLLVVRVPGSPGVTAVELALVPARLAYRELRGLTRSRLPFSTR